MGLELTTENLLYIAVAFVFAVVVIYLSFLSGKAAGDTGGGASCNLFCFFKDAAFAYSFAFPDVCGC